jgi:hypothetical protein
MLHALSKDWYINKCQSFVCRYSNGIPSNLGYNHRHCLIMIEAKNENFGGSGELIDGKKVDFYNVVSGICPLRLF